MMDTTTAARLMGGRPIGGNATFLRVATDTRSLEAGDLFVALAGERFDGHDFVAQALAQGAAAAMVDASRAGVLDGHLIVVADTRAALAALAGQWRARFDVPLVVVAGSNGKTTVKEMTAAILRSQFGEGVVLATHGNFNNAIGLPLTLLGLRSTHRAAVIELGMNHRGETRELAAIARPTVALVNNAQREHQEFMRSVDEVAQEHADAIRALRAGGIAVINDDDAHGELWRVAARDAGAHVIGFALDVLAEGGAAAGGSSESAKRASSDQGGNADMAAGVRGRARLTATGSDIEIEFRDDRFRVHLAVPGAAMARNALAATAAAMAMGATAAAVTRGLGAFRPIAGRLAARASAIGTTIIDDTYNANPDSVREAIDVLALAQGERWLVLGDMGEVGEEGPAFHREIGAYARARGIDRLLAAGEQARGAVVAFGARGEHFASVDALIAAMVPPAGSTVLVKGSRFMRMERVTAALCATSADATAGRH